MHTEGPALVKEPRQEGGAHIARQLIGQQEGGESARYQADEYTPIVGHVAPKKGLQDQPHTDVEPGDVVGDEAEPMRIVEIGCPIG
jgi:hypothetical protein